MEEYVWNIILLAWATFMGVAVKRISLSFRDFPGDELRPGDIIRVD